MQQIQLLVVSILGGKSCISKETLPDENICKSDLIDEIHHIQAYMYEKIKINRIPEMILHIAI